MKMLKLVCFFSLFFLGLTSASQESSFELINLHDTTMMIQSLSHPDAPIAVSVNQEDLGKISSTILMAESWLRTHVLSHYPATKITTIVAGHTVLCSTDQNHKLGMILPSVKNLFHSLTRWGLEKDIKISLAFSSDCFTQNFAKFRDDLAENVIKPLLNFLQTTNSTYSINPPSDFSLLDDNASLLVSSHSNSIEKLGFLGLKKFNFLIKSENQRKPISRKLISLMGSELVDPYPARPTPLPEISPIHSSIGYSVPANIVKNPTSPQSSTALPPHITIPNYSPQSSPPSIPPTLSPSSIPSFAPKLSPVSMFFPPLSSSPTAFPPCNPYHSGGPVGPVPPPERGVVEQDLWCVAKPTVPAETLQEAMDYACGAGGGDCEEIGPRGSCYYPDTVVAHASFAFNSYWQKKKRNGGTCSFGGTAMIINADPSFLHCRFVIS